ncbi:AraC family transcriptional regulator [Enterococcus hulanensis]|uniref:AraC family transcriptional regulator n=1 Tax=Enterococcus TaxID=1350 RepID=UPI000B731E9D|nr:MULTISPECIES: AraC family transcriptional regulator [Enterococcus]MBO0410165.1 AraC family transcriptional regulator [Enterococcus hulanensis]OTO14663.1 hypothetical protein A5875_003820 [Enterococcus sp. 3H8_DIV0648]
MDWIKRFLNAIDYIEDNLTNDISFDEAARIALCSKNYFQRMFSYVTGMTLSEYARQRRMTLAAFDLQNSDMKVQEIGAKYNYVSPTSFHRAFRDIHGVSPSQARIPGTEMNSFPRIHLSISMNRASNLRYRVEKREEMRFVGVRTSLPKDVSQYEKYYGKFWLNAASVGVIKKIIELEDSTESDICGLIKEDENGPSYYLAIRTNKSVPKGMTAVTLPTSKWAVFTYFGDELLTYEEANRRFFTEWLPFSGFEEAQIAEMKVYPLKEVLDDPKVYCSKCEFWIAIR